MCMTNYLSDNAFQEVKSWVGRNARPIEFALWQYHFGNGSKEAVLSALSYYQNDDGGFGKAIEPDNWNTESTPYAVDFAIKLLRQIDFYETNHPIYQNLLRFLKDTPYQADYGWFFTIPSNDNFPHAGWWQYNADENRTQSIGTTASLAGFILRYMGADAELHHVAANYADMLIDKLKTIDQYGDMGLVGYCDLYRDLRSANLSGRFDLDFLETKTKTLVQKKLKEVSWSNHLDMAVVLPNPSSVYYPGNEQVVSNALDELLQIRPQNGVWDIPWNWYDGGVYTKEFAITENWWKAYKAIERLLFLRSHGRLRVNRLAE